METSPAGEEPTSWDERYNINLMPSELFLKFRKEIQGIRVGVNLEFYNAPRNDFQAKLVFKPLAPDRLWKFVYEPIHQDVRILSKKIPVTKFLNHQTTLGLCPGVDFRFGLRADYVLPEITGGLGTDEPLFNMNSGQLQASLDRVEAILSYPDTEIFVETKKSCHDQWD
ncbi:hypothetical protein ACJRO7_015946 [Eucalyptus globulus]|uniref:DUF7781 domain-containing protein n=1 Tax=Eucalyptus globulus TaxID=34317 RepID=A0ABD3L916_EUCGL